MSKDNGGAAFPTAHDGSGDDGMALRDYFAAKAMGAAMAHYVYNDSEMGTWQDELAADSYSIADAMLAARTAGD